MSSDELDRALRILTRRRPFRPFFIELHSGDRIQVSHPEAVRRDGELYLHRGPDSSHRLFTGPSVCQLIDPPPAGSAG